MGLYNILCWLRDILFNRETTMEVTKDQTKQIIENQIAQWKIASKDLEISIRVHTKIKSDMLPALIEKITQAETAILELEIMLKELE